MQSLISKIKSMSHTQKTGIEIAVLVLFGALLVGGVYNSQNKDVPMLAMETEIETEQYVEIVEDDTEVFALQEMETEMETETEVTEEVEEIHTMTFTGSSIEKDLKLKFMDDVSGRIKGVPFEITITKQGSTEGETYKDKDMDGIIHIKDMEGGAYVVTLAEVEGYIIRENPVTFTVKEKIEYEKVEIKDEVQDGTGSQAVAEDKSGNTGGTVATQKPAEEVKKEDPLKSTAKAEKIAASEVNMTEFTKSSISSEENRLVVKQVLPGEQESEMEDTGSLEETNKPESLPITISADVKLPKQLTLYYLGEDVSKTGSLNLEVNNTSGIITSWDWAVDNSEVVSISLTDESKTCAIFTGLKEGTANVSIAVSYMADEAGTIQTDVIKSTIIVSKFTDDTTKLLDKQGNVLYLDEKAEKIATMKDYGTTDFFYGNVQYTGWQTMDGNRYYYDENHHRVTGTQTIGGVRYEFKQDGSLVQETMGIDVSKWQGKIDWKAVANAGVDFAIIRVGYRGSQNGVIYEDPRFKENIAGATAAGIKVGVYFFSQAITEAEAVEEASMALSYVSGYKVSFPIYIDTEMLSGGRANSLSRRERTDVVKAFCKTVQNAGYKPGVYANMYWFRDNLYSSELESYSIWVARYNDTLGYAGKYDMWQYTDSGKINGIKEYVDMNICYRAY